MPGKVISIPRPVVKQSIVKPVSHTHAKFAKQFSQSMSHFATAFPR